MIGIESLAHSKNLYEVNVEVAPHRYEHRIVIAANIKVAMNKVAQEQGERVVSAQTFEYSDR